MSNNGPQQDGSAETGREAPIAEQVFQRFLELVRRGVFRPGQLLPPERDLAKMLNVGRPTLREALRALALFGVLEIRQREGTYIKKPDIKGLLEPLRAHLALDARSMDDLFEARIVIESGIAELAAERLERAQLLELEECIDVSVEVLEDPKAFQRADERFHELISRAVPNEFLSWMTSSLWELGKASRDITTLLPGVPSRSHKDHVRILEALKQRDGRLAAETMRRHIENVYGAYLLAATSLGSAGRPVEEIGSADESALAQLSEES